MRSGLLTVALIVAALAAGLAPAGSDGRAATALACKAGSMRAVVGGRFVCLRPGQRCSARFRADYARSGLACRSGRLRKTATAPAVPATRHGASRTDPVPLGRPGRLANGWILTVTDVEPNATDTMRAAAPENEPPPSGFQYVLVQVSARYAGPGGSHLNPHSSLRAISATGSVYSTFNSYCGTLPQPNLDLGNPLVFTGGSVGGYAVCWRVPKAEVRSLVMAYQPLLGKTQLWFALR